MNLFSNLNSETEFTMDMKSRKANLNELWAEFSNKFQSSNILISIPSIFMNQNTYSLRSSIWNYLLTNWNEGCGALYIWNVNSVKNDRCFKKWWYTHTGTSEPRGAREGGRGGCDCPPGFVRNRSKTFLDLWLLLNPPDFQTFLRSYHNVYII